MDAVSKSLTPDEVTKLCDDFNDYPHILRTIRYFAARFPKLPEPGRTEAIEFLRDLQQVANQLAIGEADAKN